MKIKNFFIILVSLAISGFYAGTILAQESDALANITFPIAELGNCESKADCKIYCDQPENISACINFAEKNNLMPKQEIEHAKKFIAAGTKGPGGCTSKDTCEAYCDNIENIDECVAFAEKNGMMPPHELAEAKKIQSAIKRGVKPPSCGNKSECDAYCEAPENMEECMEFGIAAGFIEGEELANAKKMLSALKRGVRPPPCRGKDECDAYCSEPANMEMCMEFAIEAGFMDEREVRESKQVLAAIKKGVRPPKCRGERECDLYCSQEENFEECTNFAIAAGFMSAEEAEMAKKTMGKTPGDCRGREECDAFCKNPDNQQICFDFAKEHGLIPQEELQRMEQEKGKMREMFGNMPTEVRECINTKLGSGVVEKIQSGELMPSRELGETMSGCFRELGPQMGMPGGPDGEFRTGPGGCSNPEECRRYCENHPDECQGVGPDGRGMMRPPEGEFRGPGGCSSPEECRKYCEENPEECQHLRPGDEPQPMDGRVMPPPDEQYPPPPRPDYEHSDEFRPAPEGCSTPEECKRQYCIEHPDECARMMEESEPRMGMPVPPDMLPPSDYGHTTEPEYQVIYEDDHLLPPPIMPSEEMDYDYPPPPNGQDFPPPGDYREPPPDEDYYKQPPPPPPEDYHYDGGSTNNGYITPPPPEEFHSESPPDSSSYPPPPDNGYRE